MDPITPIVIIVIACLAGGFGAGWGLKPDASAKALEAQAGAIEAIQEGQAEILAEVNQPVVLDAELKATLAEVPAQCRKDLGGDPMSPICAWADCVRHGVSAAQRPECRAVEAAMIESFKGCEADKQ